MSMTDKQTNRPAYRVETERLVLRGMGPEDAPAVRAALTKQ